MIVFYLTIPLMILGTAIAVVPLLFAMKHQQEWEDRSVQAAQTGSPSEQERVAA